MQPEPPSDDMLLSGAVDALVFGTFESEFAVLPAGPFRSKAAREERDAFLAENQDKLCVTREQLADAKAMADAVLSSPVASGLLDRGEPQVSFRWLDQSGVRLKCRFDFLRDDGDIVELKAIRRPISRMKRFRERWASYMVEYGCDRQAALYCRGRDRAGLEGKHYFIVVYKGRTHPVFVMETGQTWLMLGDRKLDRALVQLRDCYDFENWTVPGTDQVHPTHAPDWAMREEFGE